MAAGLQQEKCDLFNMEPVILSCSSPPGQGPSTHGGEQNKHVPATLYPIVKVQSNHERSFDQRENKLKRKRKETAEKENSPASVTDGSMKPSMDNFSDIAVDRATRTPPPEPPKNQESALRPLTTQNSTRVQMKHPGGPNLTYVKPEDKTKDSGKKQPCTHNSSSSAVTATPCPEETVSENTPIHKPRARTLGVLNVHKPGAHALGAAYKKTRTENSCNAEVLQPRKHNSSSSAATATPSPEKTVNENAHIHKPGARALGVLNVRKITHIHKPGACALGVVNKKPSTDKPFSQNHKLITAPPCSSMEEEFDASFRKLVNSVSSGGLKERSLGKRVILRGSPHIKCKQKGGQPLLPVTWPS
ncbi:uncharacterized protein LOC142830746 [Pelodiscus sinensis]|uniref:uncharacterized protein LOC142830746 n=1 Tax=Pelodiscus sinensis TaxID=13735 RepID=UPI003F6C924A